MQNVFLLAASYVFYGYWDWRFTFLIFTSTIVDFFVGRYLNASQNQLHRKALLLVSIFVNLGILAFFKYYNFFMASAASALSSFGFQPHLSILNIILPIGISFYTFKTLTYTIDIYRRKIEPTNDFIAYALFTSFFPQILAGPIDRAATLIPQIIAPRHITRAQIMTGLSLILLGFFKKVAIADSLAPFVNETFSSPGTMSGGQLWSGMYAYTLQIYGDFSGYTDIARGISLILGFKTMENFNSPYLSRSITEFWQRWHISLSSWFRDYLYIPLGGNRKGSWQTYRNLFIIMLLCGLWHGAAWTFVIWGIVHGFFLIFNRIMLHGKKPSLAWPSSAGGWLLCIGKIVLTFHLVALAWVLFRADSIGNAVLYYTGLFNFHYFGEMSYKILFAGTLIFALDIAQIWTGHQRWLVETRRGRIVRFALVQLMLLSVIAATIAHLNTVTPFIYFQF